MRRRRGARIFVGAGCLVAWLVGGQIAVAQQICGDLDNSGSVSAVDALRLLRFAVGQGVSVSCPAGLNCWDTDSDGVCDEAEDRDDDGMCDVADCQPDPAVIDMLTSRIETLESALLALDERTACMSANGTDTVFEGCNVHVRSGAGATDAPLNGLGNLIVGYDEDGAGPKDGSHNVVVGMGHTYASYGGLVAGESNEVSGDAASVTGGRGNLASGNFSSVSGGGSRSATGEDNWTGGDFSSQF